MLSTAVKQASNKLGNQHIYIRLAVRLEQFREKKREGLEMKPLLPTLKEKKRYLVYELESEKVISPHAIIRQVQKILGIFDSAKAGLLHISYENKRGVIKTSLESVTKVRAALTLIKEIDASAVRINVIGTSGILNKTSRFEKKSI